MFTPDHVPADLADVLTAVRRWSPGDSSCSDSDHGTARSQINSPSDRASWIVGLQWLADAVNAAMLHVLSDFDAAGDGEVLHGAASSLAWLRGALGLAPGEAAERVRLARSSRAELAVPVQRMREGRIRYDHVKAIERPLRRLPDDVHEDAVEFLTDLSERTDVGRLRAAARHLEHVVDPEGVLKDCEKQFERRYLTLSPMLDGMTGVDGLLDAESAALLNAALKPFLVPAGPEDNRSTSQRRADGLIDVVRAACDHRLLPEVGGERPHLQVLCNLDASMPGLLPSASGSPGLLHPTAVDRASCDAQVMRAVLDADGVLLDLGRRVRVFSADQRRFLAMRDGGCRFPNCDRAPAYTDAHHIVSWRTGGDTNVSNALLLCRFHHRLVHEGGWHVRPLPDSHQAARAAVFTGPLGQRLESRPRGP